MVCVWGGGIQTLWGSLLINALSEIFFSEGSMFVYKQSTETLLGLAKYPE